MKQHFPGYYRATEDEVEDAWSHGLVVLDANVLLNLYRVSARTRRDFLSMLKRIRNQLWLPHQVAEEFHRNRYGVISAQQDAYRLLRKALSKGKDDLMRKINEIGQHPTLDRTDIVGRIDKVFTQLSAHVEKLEKRHPRILSDPVARDLSDDPIRSELVRLFEENIGPPYQEERLIQIFAEGERRYAERVPPGFGDSAKTGARRYGDLVVWYQLMDKSKETQRPVLFVTDERKADWWLIHDARLVAPRPELRQEMRTRAGTEFHLYKWSDFLDEAGKRFGRDVTTSAAEAEELQPIGLGDETADEGASQEPSNADAAIRLAALAGDSDRAQRMWVTHALDALGGFEGDNLRNIVAAQGVQAARNVQGSGLSDLLASQERVARNFYASGLEDLLSSHARSVARSFYGSALQHLIATQGPTLDEGVDAREPERPLSEDDVDVRPKTTSRRRRRRPNQATADRNKRRDSKA
ncbi:MAG TPA: PIN-like domain-containing protein [Actinomycetota bacterium]|nr:PIN-like domain-containing protein [Actinomycetota bacterium]